MASENLTEQALLDLAKATLIANTTAPIALVAGDPLLALLQASVTADLVIDAMLRSAKRLTRATTSKGANLDSWFGDFNFVRIPSLRASGIVNFTIDTTIGANIPVGFQVSSVNSSAVYTVVADPSNIYFAGDPFNVYQFLPGGMATQPLPIQALNGGVASNVAAGALTSLAYVPAGVRSVTNPQPISNGADVESDSAALVRFRNMMLGLGTGNEDSITAAIQGVLGENASFVFMTNRFPLDVGPIVSPVTQYRSKYVTIVAEDGSGTLTAAQIGDLKQAVGAVIAWGIGFDVRTPYKQIFDVSMVIIFDPNAAGSRGGAEQAIISAVSRYVNSRKIGEPVYYSELTHSVLELQTEYPGIVAVEIATIGPSTFIDVYPGATTVIRLGTLDLLFVPPRV